MLFWFRIQWRIQDFPEGGAPTPEEGGANLLFGIFLPKMKMKKIELRPRPRPQDPPLESFNKTLISINKRKLNLLISRIGATTKMYRTTDNAIL